MAKNKKSSTAAPKKERKTASAAPAEAPKEDPAVASAEANLKLVHTDDIRDQQAVTATGAPVPKEPEEGRSVTTRDDATDLGVPMLPGSPQERVGPEDALGPGAKRGDYTDRLGGDSYHPHEGSEPQKPRADEIGDETGKGGVNTSASS